MGGWGSGKRWHSKAVTADYRRIDVLWMKRQGYLRANAGGTLTWSRHGEKIASTGYQSTGHSLRLIYRYRYDGEDWQDVDMAVQLSWSPCRFGGERPYFICPAIGCGKRVQHLYGGSRYYVCRHCLNLAYQCQKEELLDRAARRADKLREKLECEPGILNGAPYRKPKGMHWRTYQRLCWQEAYFRSMSLNAMCSKFGLPPNNYIE